MAAKKLITEACVRAMAPGSELVLGPDAIATPSALDLAFERGIPVVYGSAPPPAARSGLWERMLAADGQYVVTVSGGRAVVHRLTASGPVELGREPGAGPPGGGSRP